MTRAYRHCPRCGERMRKLGDIYQDDLKYYFCVCGYMETFYPGINAASEGWPEEMIKHATESNLI